MKECLSNLVPAARIAVCLVTGLLLSAGAADAQFVVNSVGDEPDLSPLDLSCLTAAGTCTLRAAIAQANATPGPNTIGFGIAGAGPHTITPGAALPFITDTTTIDGYTQPGAAPNTNPADPAVGPRLGSNAVLRVVLAASGLRVDNATGCVIRGLVISGSIGIKVHLNGGSGHRIEGNFIGTDVTGLIDASPIGEGIRIVGSANAVIGGVLPSQRNVIAGNTTNILANFTSYRLGPARVVVQGNLIGTNAPGTAAFTGGIGITLTGGTNPALRPPDANVIGGADADDGSADGLVQARNVIAGPSIGIHNNNSLNTRISGNFIGTDVTGEIPLGSFGGIAVEVDGISTGTLVGGWSGSLPVPGAANVICCSNIGVAVYGSTGNPAATAGVRVQGNAIGQSLSGAPLGLGTIGVDLGTVDGVLVGGPAFQFDSNVIGCVGGEAALCPGAGINAYGIRVSHTTSATIESNIITRNAGRGISVGNSERVQLTKNHLVGNNAIGIDLLSGGQLPGFVTPNDALDADTGANGLQNYPVLSAASGSMGANGTTIEGSLHSTPGETFTIEFFASNDVNKDPSGFGEGEFWWGSALGPFTVSTDAFGDASFSFVIAPNLPVFTDTVITATATDSLNNTSEFSQWVPVTLVNSPPVADAGTAQPVNEGDVVALDGSQSSDADGDPLTFSWSQTAGPPVLNPTGLDTATPSFTAPPVGPGLHIVTLTLTVSDGNAQDTDTVDISIVNVNHAPVANAGLDQTVNEGAAVALSGAASSDPDNDGLTYGWQQTGGPPVVNPAGLNTVAPTFTAPQVAAAGATVTFTLTVDDGAGASAQDQVTIQVRNVNHAPIANAGPDQSVASNTLATLNGSGSSDADQDPLTYGWTQLAGPAVGPLAPTATPSFASPEVGASTALTFRLVVNDGITDSAPDDVTITVTPAAHAPVANAGPDQAVNEGTLVTLTGAASSDALGHALQYAWTQIGGPPVGPLAATATPGFTAPEILNGTVALTFRLVVNDGGANSDPDDVVLTVRNVNQPPVADAGPNRTVDEGTIVALDGRASTDPDQDPLSYAWRQTAGPPVINPVGFNTVTPAFTAPPLALGFTLVTFELTVSDGTFSSTDTVVITVLNVNQAPVADAGPDQLVSGGTIVTLNGSASHDPDGDALTFSWALVLGDPVGPLSPTAIATFTSPITPAGTTLRFVLTVSDGQASAFANVTITVKPSSLPDLVVSVLSIGGLPGPGGPIDVTDTTHNIGRGPVGASVTRFVLSRTPSLGGEVGPLGRRVVPPLAAGAAHTATTRFTMPVLGCERRGCWVDPGVYYVIAVVDDEGTHAERSEANNVTSTATTVMWADLTVSRVAVIGGVGNPPVVSANRPLTLDVTIRNLGGSVPASVTEIRFGTGAQQVVGFAQPADVFVAGEQRTFRLVVPLQPDQFHLTRITAVADALQQVTESHEQNNAASTEVTIAYPNLALQWIAGTGFFEASPLLQLTPGQSQVTVRLTAANRAERQETAPLDRVTTTDYLLQKLDPAGFPVGDRIRLGFGGLPPLGPGETYTDVRTFTLPPQFCPTGDLPCPTPTVTPGEYVLIVKLDAPGEVAESDEDDNIASVSMANRFAVLQCTPLEIGQVHAPGCPRAMQPELAIGLPDLLVTGFEVPSGEPLFVWRYPLAVTVFNRSAVPTVTTSVIVWFSTDQTLDENDHAVRFGLIPGLRPLEEREFLHRVSLHDIPDGEYYLFIEVDPHDDDTDLHGDVVESNEDNNVLEGPFLELDR